MRPPSRANAGSMLPVHTAWARESPTTQPLDTRASFDVLHPRRFPANGSTRRAQVRSHRCSALDQ